MTMMRGRASIIRIVVVTVVVESEAEQQRGWY